MDRLSHLPEIPVHNILSKLPKKDAVKTCVLSKAWAERWYTFPILSFNDFKSEKTPYTKVEAARMRKNFIDYVNRRLQRFSDRGLAIKELNLVLHGFELHSMSKDVDRWLKLAVESRVESVDLYIPYGPDKYGHGKEYQIQTQVYTLPAGVIEAKSVTQLALRGDIRVDKAFMNHSDKSFSLRVLTLERVFLGDERAVEDLISRCPSIEQITLKRCKLSPDASHFHMFETNELLKLSMLSLPKLKGVYIQGIQEVYIDAPSLENLDYAPSVQYRPLKLDFDTCRNLRRLCLFGLGSSWMITEEWFRELFLKFPFLEILKLDHCTNRCERINISSDRLQVLELLTCYDLKEVHVDAPNLLSFEYVGADRSQPIISFPRSSSQLVVNVLINIAYANVLSLKKFIQNIKPQNVLASLSLWIDKEVGVMVPLNLDVLLESSPPANIKHLNLRSVPNDDKLFSSLVNILLSTCRPETISFSLDHLFGSRPFIEFFYETLIGKKEGICNCTPGDTKCWWHGLNDVKFTSSLKIENNVDLKTFLESVPFYVPDGTNITFSL